MSNDASKLSIPVLLALSAITPLILVGVSYGMQSTRLDNVKESVAVLQGEQNKINAMALQIARLETKVDFVISVLERQVDHDKAKLKP